MMDLGYCAIRQDLQDFR